MARRATFQSTRPRGARQTMNVYLREDVDFNPRARVGRDECASLIHAYEYLFQSTRPRGRDGEAHLSARHSKISIHAPTRGATVACCCRGAFRIISIHAPTRGATRYRVVVTLDAKFQSTRPRGARQQHILIRPPVIAFQSTRPRGARRTLDEPRHDLRHFNPRAHAGRDERGIFPRHSLIISIHAPTRGATSFPRTSSAV